MGQNRENHDVAGGIVGGEKILAGLVERKVARIFPERRALIEWGEFAGLGIDREGANSALLAVLVGGIGVLAIRMDDNVGGSDRFRSKTLPCELAGCGVKIEGVDAFAARLAGIRADECKVMGIRRRLPRGSRVVQSEKG